MQAKKKMAARTYGPASPNTQRRVAAQPPAVYLCRVCIFVEIAKCIFVALPPALRDLPPRTGSLQCILTFVLWL
jgi:hypothetical protein